MIAANHSNDCNGPAMVCADDCLIDQTTIVQRSTINPDALFFVWKSSNQIGWPTNFQAL